MSDVGKCDRKEPKQGVHGLHPVRNFTQIFTQHDGVMWTVGVSRLKHCSMTVTWHDVSIEACLSVFWSLFAWRDHANFKFKLVVLSLQYQLPQAIHSPSWRLRLHRKSHLAYNISQARSSSRSLGKVTTSFSVYGIQEFGTFVSNGSIIQTLRATVSYPEVHFSISCRPHALE